MVPHPERLDDTSNAPLDTKTEEADSKQSTNKPKPNVSNSQTKKRVLRKRKAAPVYQSHTPTKKQKCGDKCATQSVPNTVSCVPQCVRDLHAALTTALGGANAITWLLTIARQPLPEVARVINLHADAFDNIVAALNSLPAQFASDHPALHTDSTVATQCHHLLLHTYKPVPTCGDGNCGFRALSLALTGSEQLHGLIRVLCAYAVVKYRSVMIEMCANSYPGNSHQQILHMYHENLRHSVCPGHGWANDHPMFALSLLLNRPIFQYNTFYSQRPGSTERELLLGDTRDVQHLADRFRAREQGTTTHLLYCSNTVAVSLAVGGISHVPHPPLAVSNLANYHWVAMLPLAPSVMAHVPIPTTRITAE